MTRLKYFLFALVFGLFTAASWAAQLDINTATAEQISQAMNGVGPNKAQAIVQYREQHGPFKRIEDLVQVRGIGKQTIEKNRTLISVSAEALPAGGGKTK